MKVGLSNVSMKKVLSSTSTSETESTEEEEYEEDEEADIKFNVKAQKIQQNAVQPFIMRTEVPKANVTVPSRTLTTSSDSESDSSGKNKIGIGLSLIHI